MNSYTTAATSDQIERLQALLRDQGWEFSEKPHASFSARRGKLSVTAYDKGPKILVQGKETEDFVRFTLEPQILGQAVLGYENIHNPAQFEPHFGIDESGKGDFFGPLVVAGVYTDATITRTLMDAGIRDSKRITSGKRIRDLAAIIRNTPGCTTAMVSLGPERYNSMYATFGNLNRLLAWAHARVIETLHTARPDCPRALSDQFARPDVLQRALKQQRVAITLEQRTKAESDTAVAAASILARERFIDWIDKTSQACGIPLPLGASGQVVEAATQLVAARGSEALARAAKMHFRTASIVLHHHSHSPSPEDAENP